MAGAKTEKIGQYLREEHAASGMHGRLCSRTLPRLLRCGSVRMRRVMGPGAFEPGASGSTIATLRQRNFARILSRISMRLLTVQMSGDQRAACGPHGAGGLGRQAIGSCPQDLEGYLSMKGGVVREKQTPSPAAEWHGDL